MTYQIPSFYDSVNLVTRPMDSGAQIPPAQMAVSVARAGNTIQVLPDGLYVGTVLPQPVVYVNSSTGVDAPTSGTKVAPYATLDYALAQAIANSVNTRLSTPLTVALQSGQTFAFTNDVAVYGSQTVITFYGDTQYGDFNSAAIGTGAEPAMMSDLVRPIIVPVVSNVAGQWHMAGFNRNGGTIQLLGVQVNLPAAPATPSITLYSQYADFVRSLNYAGPGSLILEGTIINMTDTTAYWGICGTMPRSTGMTMVQYGSQFQVNGILLTATSGGTTAQLTARKYFVKFYADSAGNNQTQMVLSGTTATTSSASGILNLTWADTESLTVATGKTNQASFPIMFDINYGFRNYIYGLLNDQQQRPTNVISSRLF
jgi:hypothetical protein